MGLFDFLGDIVKEVATQSAEELRRQRREQEERENRELLEYLYLALDGLNNINNNLVELYELELSEENAFTVFSSAAYYAALFSNDLEWFKQYYEPAIEEEDFLGLAAEIDRIIDAIGTMFEEVPEDEEGAEVYTEMSIKKESQRYCMKVKMLIDRLEASQINESIAFYQIQDIIKHFSSQMSVFTGNLLCFYMNGIDEMMDY